MFRDRALVLRPPDVNGQVIMLAALYVVGR